MLEYVTIGNDSETGELITIGDIERRSGLYLLGRPRTGKTTLIKRILEQDMEHGHGVFFLDPHGDAIEDLKKRIPTAREHDVTILDPTDETHAFGINLLACKDITSRGERRDTYTKTYNVFKKLFADESSIWGPWMQQAMQFTLHAFIENQECTLAEVPMFLDPKEKAFRNYIVGNIKQNLNAADFWRSEFSRPEREQRERGNALLTRVQTLLGQPDVRDIVCQHHTTVDFADIMEKRRILFVKLSANLSQDIKEFIGTILISELVHAVRLREHIPQDERHQFCIFVDEVQHFAGVEDFDVLFTEAGKYAIATTIAHQERYGQFGDNKAILGATDAAGNKIFFRLSVRDAEEQAPEFAKDSPTETKRERALLISQEPVADLLRGHANPDIRRFVNEYLRYLYDKREDTNAQKEQGRLHRQYWQDEASYIRASVEIDDLRGVIVQNSRVLAATREAVQRAQGQTATLLQLYERSENLRHTLRFFDRFLTELMEGHIAPGQERFSTFLIDRVRDFASLPKMFPAVLELYISLSYGDPTRARSIPFAFAKARGLFPEAVSPIDKQMEEQKRREKEKWVKEQWDQYHSGRQIALAQEQGRKQDVADRVLQKLREWKSDAGGHFQFDSIPPYNTEQLLMAYIPLLKYQSVQEILKPYYPDGFASPWAENFPSRAEIIRHLLQDLQLLRRENAAAKEYIRRQQRAKWAWFGRGEVEKPPGWP